MKIVGIDEVGRGPLAGPVTIGVVSIPYLKLGIIRRVFKNIRDSKQLTPSEREEWFEIICQQAEAKNISFCVTSAKNFIIDRDGISQAIRKLIARSLVKLKAHPLKTKIFLDGGLKAPRRYLNQKTIIKGDEKITVISIASVAAKVLRDRHMKKIAKSFPEYGFEIHKGYGTPHHIEKIKKYGPCELHRMSFIKNFINVQNS